jgi:hypothetical protein
LHSALQLNKKRYVNALGKNTAFKVYFSPLGGKVKGLLQHIQKKVNKILKYLYFYSKFQAN